MDLLEALKNAFKTKKKITPNSVTQTDSSDFKSLRKTLGAQGNTQNEALQALADADKS